ncbi:LysE family transporter [Streptantibioticus ferralitis]|uniref:LysE family transporter n=1 Tax=Streptantibioticus ferralitis TaxID=236510 RepID=A0ABT5Z536_9ACTN|nr:LysE family transporter [Streptantibioticus ferralitis]MDF2258914.1 LysE family transporter [Streptantibioticus ferralitis]
MIAALVAGLLAGYGIAMPVGAVATYLVVLTARTSLKIGVCAALGVATADGLYALIAVIGGSTLTRVVEPMMHPLRGVSVVALIALAARSATTALIRYRKPLTATQPEERPLGPVRAYMGLWGVTMMNPLTLIYFAALVLGSQSPAAPNHLEQAVFVLAAFAASASWQVLLAGGGALFGRLLTSGRGRLVTAVASSALITVLAVRMLFAQP